MKSVRADHLLVSAMAAYVGLDPAEINWVANPSVSQVELFTAGEVDAFIGFPPDPKQPCPRKVGHVVVNIAHDRPWSNYFCCMVTANADFLRNNPVATKRAIRAILKATDYLSPAAGTGGATDGRTWFLGTSARGMTLN